MDCLSYKNSVESTESNTHWDPQVLCNFYKSSINLVIVWI